MFGIGLIITFADDKATMSNRRDKNKPTLNRQLEQLVEMNAEKEKDDNQIQFGKFLYSLSGLTYAGVVLTLFVNFDEEKVNALVIGIVLTIAFAIFAWLLVKRGNVKKIRL